MKAAEKSILHTFLLQQNEMGIPPLYISTSKKSPSEGASVISSMQPLHEEPALNSLPPIQSPQTKREKLAELYKEVQLCAACSLSRTRVKPVFGGGNAEASILIIGEAPNYDEDQQGRPFLGAPGELLIKMLRAIEIDHQKDVFYTGIVKCRPQGNRTPSVEEILSCMPFLRRQIAIIEPKVIILLGEPAIEQVLSIDEPLQRIHGNQYTYMGIPVFVTFPPSEMLRNTALKRPTWDDLQKFKTFFKELS